MFNTKKIPAYAFTSQAGISVIIYYKRENYSFFHILYLYPSYIMKIATISFFFSGSK